MMIITIITKLTTNNNQNSNNNNNKKLHCISENYFFHLLVTPDYHQFQETMMQLKDYHLLSTFLERSYSLAKG